MAQKDAFSYQLVQACGSAEVLLDLELVLRPVAVVTAGNVVDDGRDPDGIEAHACDVVQPVHDAFECAAAVVALSRQAHRWPASRPAAGQTGETDSGRV